MKLTFHLPYRAKWGETLEVALHLILTQGRVRIEYIPMITSDGFNWSIDYSLMPSWHRSYVALFYAYQLRGADGLVERRECNPVPRAIALSQDCEYEFYDSWQDWPLHWQCACKDNGIQVSLRPDKINIVPVPLAHITVILNVRAYGLLPQEQIAVLGDTPTMGRWLTNRYLPMDKVGDNCWMVSINADMISHFPFQYKYVIVNSNTQNMVYWEAGDNRISCSVTETTANKVIALNDNSVRIKRLPIYRCKPQSAAEEGYNENPLKKIRHDP